MTRTYYVTKWHKCPFYGYDTPAKFISQSNRTNSGRSNNTIIDKLFVITYRIIYRTIPVIR